MQTSNNQELIHKARKEIRQSQKEKASTFLTGTGIYTEDIPQTRHEVVNLYEEPDNEAMLRELTKKGEYDDLAELRRMIKETGQNLDDYGKQVFIY